MSLSQFTTIGEFKSLLAAKINLKSDEFDAFSKGTPLVNDV